MEYFHLTTPQQNIWNLQKYYEDTAIANLCGAIFIMKNGTAHYYSRRFVSLYRIKAVFVCAFVKQENQSSTCRMRLLR